MLLHMPLQILNDECDIFCYNLSLFFSNISDLKLTSLIVIGDFSGRTSKWWSSDEETFEGCAIVLTTSACYMQLIDHPTHVINNSSFSCI